MDLGQVDVVLVHDVLPHTEADGLHQVRADAQDVLVIIVHTGGQPLAQNIPDAAAVFFQLLGYGLQISLADPGVGGVAEGHQAVQLLVAGQNQGNLGVIIGHGVEGQLYIHADLPAADFADLLRNQSRVGGSGDAVEGDCHFEVGDFSLGVGGGAVGGRRRGAGILCVRLAARQQGGQHHKCKKECNSSFHRMVPLIFFCLSRGRFSGLPARRGPWDLVLTPFIMPWLRRLFYRYSDLNFQKSDIMHIFIGCIPPLIDIMHNTFFQNLGSLRFCASGKQKAGCGPFPMEWREERKDHSGSRDTTLSVSVIWRIIRQGVPPARTWGGTSWVTTLPAYGRRALRPQAPDPRGKRACRTGLFLLPVLPSGPVGAVCTGPGCGGSGKLFLHNGWIAAPKREKK